MKIGIITDETENPVGMGTYILNTVENILKTDKKNKYYLIHRKKEEHKIYSMADEIIIPYFPILPFSTYRNFIKMPKVLKKYNLDIIHHTTNLGPFIFKGLMPGKKNIQTIHDIIPLLFRNTHEKAVKLAFKYFLPSIVKNADKIIAVSESTKRDLINTLGVPRDKIKVIYEGASNIYRPVKGNVIKERFGTENYILYVGALEPKKNLITLIRAFSEAKKKGVKEDLVLVGKDGWKYKEVYDEIERLDLTADVLITGYVELKDLPYIYSSAKVFVMPSLYEGFGLPVLEAMSCGTPVITSDRGSFPEIVGNAGITIDALDSEKFADAISNVLDDKELSKKMRRKGLEQAKKFTWKRTAEETIKVYEDDDE